MREPDRYELLNGTHIDGLAREDVALALQVFRALEPRRGVIGNDEPSMDAMARALDVARASRTFREALERQRQQHAVEAAALMEVRRRVEARICTGSRLS